MESVPGGSSCIYLANNIIKCITSSKLEEKDTYGIKGFKVIGEFIKSRSNEAGKTFTMIFEQSRGFDNILTNLENFKELGLLKGSPRAYYLEDCPDIKFTLKTFKEKYLANKELQEAVKKLVEENYVQFIPHYDELIDNNEEDEESVENTNEVEEDEISLVEMVDEENDIWLGSDGNYYTSEGDEVDYKPNSKRKKK